MASCKRNKYSNFYYACFVGHIKKFLIKYYFIMRSVLNYLKQKTMKIWFLNFLFFPYKTFHISLVNNLLYTIQGPGLYSEQLIGLLLKSHQHFYTEYMPLWTFIPTYYFSGDNSVNASLFTYFYIFTHVHIFHIC